MLHLKFTPSPSWSQQHTGAHLVPGHEQASDTSHHDHGEGGDINMTHQAGPMTIIHLSLANSHICRFIVCCINVKFMFCVHKNQHDILQCILGIHQIAWLLFYTSIDDDNLVNDFLS